MAKATSKKAPGSAGRNSVGPRGSVGHELAHLETLPIEGLRALWRRRFRTEPPAIQSADIVRRLVAWRIQADAYGDFDDATLNKIRRLMRGERADPRVGLKAGAVLVREWRGIEHRVLVLDNGFEHRGARYTSLTQVARVITGTRWSGPRFFGLSVDTARAAKAEGRSR